MVLTNKVITPHTNIRKGVKIKREIMLILRVSIGSARLLRFTDFFETLLKILTFEFYLYLNYLNRIL
jgi:hypothetical protein